MLPVCRFFGIVIQIYVDDPFAFYFIGGDFPRLDSTSKCSFTYIKVLGSFFKRHLFGHIGNNVAELPTVSRKIVDNLDTIAGCLPDWRLTEAEIDGFCYVWYDGIVGLHILADDVDKQTDDASIALN